MSTNKKILISACGMAMAAAASGQPLPNEYYVNDLERQFSQLTAHAEPLGFQLGVGSDPALCKHYQGAVRLRDSNGRPVFILSRSGNSTVSCPTDPDNPGELLVVEFDSRGNDGERMRSNRLARGSRFEDTAPPSTDRGTKSIRLNGSATDRFGNTWPAWCHPGGMQAVGDVLFVPVEHRWNPNQPDDGGFMIVDVSDPTDPALIKMVEMPFKIGVLGVQRNPETGRYMFLMTGGEFDSGNTLFFYWSNGVDPRDPSFNLDPTSLRSWVRDDDPNQVDRDSWREWQTINFVRNDDGALFIVCLDDDNAAGIGTGKTALYRLRNETNGAIDLDFAVGRNLGQTEPTVGDLDAMGAVYVSPSGQLLLYSGEHDNDGPGGSVRMGEYRFRDVMYPANPGCGGTITLYENHNGWDDHTSQSYTYDYRDRSLDNWDDLSNFENRTGDPNGFTDEAESVTWLIGPGYYGQLFEDDTYNGSTMFLIGDGYAHGAGGLGVLDDEVSSVRILQRPEHAYVSPLSSGPFGCENGGFGIPQCPFFGPGAVQRAATVIGAPPCFAIQTIFLEAGVYPETILIDRPMIIRTEGTGDAVIVGS
ncbi:MAG: hypothetical protein JNG88_16865 [Phycisphaerales bacterium]|nr:hypothetical protein [Phycisphaerales bacterium]